MSLIVAVLIAGCTGNVNPGTATISPVTQAPSPSGGTVVPVSTQPVSPATITTTPELVVFVANAAAYARENGKEKAISSFNDPNGKFVSGPTHIFAIDYRGNVLADALEPGIVGTNLMNMTDPFGTPIGQNACRDRTVRQGIRKLLLSERTGEPESRTPDRCCRGR